MGQRGLVKFGQGLLKKKKGVGCKIKFFENFFWFLENLKFPKILCWKF